ncbi:DMT family transporter [Thauera sp.]|jgi:drug/metabolite transporter (DMT)-like permease|uniref:DMT family transporter n=1 Tax=Thauera sp. TaxID=1905334 RepID=UPI002A35F47C|nr:DMT family transporter [Thauera sp.]MDX9887203.1 DMT family transporter [Thauera sp.]
MAMTPGIVLAVLAAALLHASWNALIRGAGDKRLYTLLLHACSAAVGAVGLLFTGLPAPESWPYLALSAVIHSAYIMLLIRAYEGGQLATSYTLMRGLPPLIVGVLSGPVLGEALGPEGALGIALISCGVIGIGFASGLPLARIVSHPSTHAAVLNAVAISAYTLVDGQGARLAGNPLAYVFCLSLLEPIGVLLAGLRSDPGALQRYFVSHWRLGFVGAIAAMLAYATVLWAMTQAPIAMVAALRESSVIFAVLIGALWFKEGHLRRGMVAGTVVMAGVFLLRNWQSG